ncbi:hypothetical protein [Methanoregula sp.]|uniref:hypothetical protein n=1 Tax=Methanoregula sp. TaxID=2052170 RepID=UPI00356332B4
MDGAKQSNPNPVNRLDKNDLMNRSGHSLFLGIDNWLSGHPVGLFPCAIVIKDTYAVFSRYI